MAFRIHLVAVQDPQEEPWEVAGRALARDSDGPALPDSHALGDWRVALASVWVFPGSDARWLAGLLSRQAHARALVATTVDDAFVELCLQQDGRVLARVEIPFGGLAEDEDEDEDEGEDEDEDEEASRERLAARIEAEVAAVTTLDWPVDEALLRAVLEGRALDQVDDAWRDPLPGWADVPELLEALGLPGLREWLVARANAEEEAARVAERGPPAEPAGPADPRRPRPTRLLGCALLAVLAVAFPLGGGVLGRELGGTGGAVLGGSAALLVLLGGLAAVLWSKARQLKQAVLGAQEPQGAALLDAVDALPRARRARLRALVADWNDLADRVGIDRGPPSLVGSLDPVLRALGSPAARDLVTGLVQGGELDPIARRLQKLRRAVLDIELSGRDPSGLRSELEALSELPTPAPR